MRREREEERVNERRYSCSIGNWVRSCEMSTHVLTQHNPITRLDSNLIFFFLKEEFFTLSRGDEIP